MRFANKGSGQSEKIGLTGAVSSCHALLTREVSQAIEDASRKVIENKFLIEEILAKVDDETAAS